MRTYSKYKDSGVDWIGEIPEGWTVTKVGQMFTSRRETVSDQDYAPLSVTKGGIVPQLENVAKTDNRDNRLLVRKGDFVINSRSDRRGSCGFSRFDGSVTQISLVLNPQGINEIDARYYSWLFSCERFSDEFYRNGHGIVADLWSTKWSDMKGIYLPQPPADSRKQIVAYLDEKMAAIDAAVADIERSIELLNEYRQSVISEAVTKGLDPNAPMKDSGIDWIGDIPAHWSIAPLKYIVGSIESGASIDASRTPAAQGEYGVLTLSSVYQSQFNPSENKAVATSDISRLKCPVESGSLLVSRCNTSEWVGTAAYVNRVTNNLYLPDKIWQLKFETDIRTRWVWYVLRSHPSRSFFASMSSGASQTMQNISKNDLLAAPICIPSNNEMKQIVNNLDSRTAQFDSLIAQKQSLVVRLKEYRSSLISECVTGKVKVPGVKEA